MKYIDTILDGITMYRVVLYSLCITAVFSIGFGFFGLIGYGGLSLIASLITLFVVCMFSNIFFAKIFKVSANIESMYITALILFFILAPLSNFNDIWMFILIGVLAMGSKYIVAIHRKHIFNPVAIALVIVGLFGSGVALWWVATLWLLPFTAIFGFLILRKTRRFSLFFVFLTTSILSISFVGIQNHIVLLDIIKPIFVSWPIIFFGTVMLTEPLTTPPNRVLQMVYGAIVGILFGLQFHVGPIYITPEFALVFGNLFAYVVSPKIRLKLTLKEKNLLAPDVYEFVFTPDQKMQYMPGQYLEWTLGHNPSDTRGNRRYFTISSSPTETEIKLGIKFYSNGSTFKKALGALPLGGTVFASQLAGTFTLPKDQNKKLVFIAGGIGVTPFRSMVKFLIDTKQKRDITLLYSNRTPQDIAYKDLFDFAKTNIGLNVIYTSLINTDQIMHDVPDYMDREFYISGPHGMVSAFETTLATLGVKKSNIKIDFFPGFA